MSNQKLPAELINFINAYIDSVLQLEILLLLHKHSDRRWTAAETDAELRINPEWVDAQLGELCHRGLLHCERGEAATYQFAPSDSKLNGLVSSLATWHTSHRVAVISAIYSKSTQKLRTFADAFRLRKDKPSG